jgi:hypothetical protein
MIKLSGCTLVRNAVRLHYPLEASLLSYLPICDEIVIAYDPASEDGTEALVHDVARRYAIVRPVASVWDMDNRAGGTEIAIQSNVAIEACTCDWILYVQADEALHEGDHDAIRHFLNHEGACGALFNRRSFLQSLDREITDHRVQGLLRLFRKGVAFATGDAMSCGLVQGARGEVVTTGWRLFNYSRMGPQEESLRRARSLHGFYHSKGEVIEQHLKAELTQSTGEFPPEEHPLPIRRYYAEPNPLPTEQSDGISDISIGRISTKPLSPSNTNFMSSPSSRPTDQCYRVETSSSASPQTSPITLGILLGPDEQTNIIPFIMQFIDWPGDLVVVDDTGDKEVTNGFRHVARAFLGNRQERVQIEPPPSHGDYAAARNRIHALARSEWIVHCDLDERWDPRLLQGLTRLIAQLGHDGKAVCGFPRANLLDGVLTNDLADSEWTEEGLKRAGPSICWPPQNRDVQFRLVRRSERWEGRIHEKPGSLFRSTGCVVEVREPWILHIKSLERQRRQDAFYRSLGQQGGMPPDDTVSIPDGIPLREAVLTEALKRLPPGPVIAVETGTLRDPSPQARFGDGWSTLHLAKLLSERQEPLSRLYSIDIEPRYIENSRHAVPEALHACVTWICDDSRKALSQLQVDRIDLLYLDSSDDPELTFTEFMIALPKLARHSVVIVDDTGSYSAGPQGKGSKIIPELERRGWRIEHRKQGTARMTILSDMANSMRSE